MPGAAQIASIQLIVLSHFRRFGSVLLGRSQTGSVGAFRTTFAPAAMSRDSVALLQLPKTRMLPLVWISVIWLLRPGGSTHESGGRGVVVAGRVVAGGRVMVSGVDAGGRLMAVGVDAGGRGRSVLPGGERTGNRSIRRRGRNSTVAFWPRLRRLRQRSLATSVHDHGEFTRTEQRFWTLVDVSRGQTVRWNDAGSKRLGNCRRQCPAGSHSPPPTRFPCIRYYRPYSAPVLGQES